MRIPHSSVAVGRTSRENDGELHARIRAEFAEMPGLKLTLPQASRLFNLEAGHCWEVLDGLVRAGHLASDGKAFVRTGGCRG